MKLIEGLLLVILLGILAIGVYFFFYFAPLGKQIEYKTFKSVASPAMLLNLVSESKQFYPNMRYPDKRIGYMISDNCDSQRKDNAEQAFSILSQKTVLTFYPDSNNPEIIVLCSDVAPTAEEANHFVAGEGGPSKIINATAYSIILLGKVSLFRVDTCDKPQVAVHEVLHALGFDHDNNKSSIMYPVTNCDQVIDQSIIDDISKLYSTPSEPDLAIEEASANKTGRYFNFQVTIENIGLKDSTDSKLIVYSGENKITEYQLGLIELGKKKILTVTDFFIGQNPDSVKFVVETNENEITTNNNVANVGIS